MKSKSVFIGMGIVGLAVAASVGAHGRDHRFRISTVLKSFEEVPAIASSASGFFKATIDPANETIAYELSYNGIEMPAQAHIHFAQEGVNGGIVVFLCSNLGNGPAGTPACPTEQPATVTGSVTAAGVLAVPAQGFAAGEFGALLAAVRKGVTYVNVHSSRFPGGEIRGQVDGHDHKSFH